MYKKHYDRNDRDYHRDHSQTYDNYMNSSEWQQKKAVRLAVDGYRCQMCGKSASLEIHHLCSYGKLGQENIYTDLVTVCHECHQKIHHLMRRVTDPSGRRGWQEIKDS